MGRFYNISNHPTRKWGSAQLESAMELANTDCVIDIKFPKVPTDAAPAEIEWIGNALVDRIKLDGPDDGKIYVMVKGEATLSCALVILLQKDSEEGYNFVPVAATTERLVEKVGDGAIKHWFEFVMFRPYCRL